MVSSLSATVQASESEKRRKQTMERAKAVHLSRQLQMRLQYARLKVEHGWQKQNLNEVENLYFHHSHLRGPKPFPAPSIIATHQHSTSFVGPSASPVQSSLSFKLATSSLGRNSINASSLQGYDQSKNHTSDEDANPPNPPQQSFPIIDHTLSSNFDPSPKLPTPGLMEVVVEDTENALSLPTPPSQTSTDHPTPLGDQTDAIGLISPLRNSKSPIDPAPPLPNPHSTVKPQRRSQKVPSTVLRAPTASSTTKDMFNFTSTGNLTYDSFWSSHTGPTTPQSRRDSHSDIMADYPLTLQTSGNDYNNRITSASLLNNPVSTSNN